MCHMGMCSNKAIPSSTATSATSASSESLQLSIRCSWRSFFILMIFIVIKIKKCCKARRARPQQDRDQLLLDDTIDSAELQVLHPSIIRGAQARTSVIDIKLDQAAIDVADTPQSPSSPDEACEVDCAHLSCRFVRDKKQALKETKEAKQRLDELNKKDWTTGKKLPPGKQLQKKKVI